jgi:predicted porin
MKRTLIALGVAATVALPMVAEAAPKVYGRLNITVENIDDDTKWDQRWEVVSNASRFGVKGEDELTANLSAVYLMEWEVSGDGNSGTDLGQRNRFIGIKSPTFGTIKLGKYDTYLKLAQGEVDLFNDMNADMGKVIAGENRINNVIGYESPKFLDALSVNLMVAPGEEAPGAAAPSAPPAAGTQDDNGLSDYISASVVYSNEDLGLYGAIAMDKNVISTFNAADTFQTAPTFSVTNTSVAGGGASLKTDKTDIIRAVIGYNIKDIGLTLNALVQQAERSDDAAIIEGFEKKVPEEESWLVSAAYKIGESWVAKAQYVTSTTSVDIADAKDVDMTQASLGLDYNFTSKTRAYGYYSLRNVSNDNNPTTTLVATNGKTNDFDVSFVGLGIDHKF